MRIKLTSCLCPALLPGDLRKRGYKDGEISAVAVYRVRYFQGISGGTVSEPGTAPMDTVSPSMPTSSGRGSEHVTRRVERAHDQAIRATAHRDDQRLGAVARDRECP